MLDFFLQQIESLKMYKKFIIVTASEADILVDFFQNNLQKINILNEEHLNNVFHCGVYPIKVKANKNIICKRKLISQ